ncbi:cytochrome P450 [Streptomyces sp. NPDC056891]|uniref:cytochrome P450 n=1 Tax=Streptomyces sp. NPDC056891 TaxID=3345961 RepID=UPI00368701A8
MPATAISRLDLLDERVLEDPYPVYGAMRRMGPAVYLERHGVWAIPGHHEIASILGAVDVFRTEGPRALTPLAGAVLPFNGEQQARLRQVLAHRLGPRAVARLQKDLEVRAWRLVAEHCEGGFDAVALARDMAAGTVMDLMGLPLHTRPAVLEVLTMTLAAPDVLGPPAAGALASFLATAVTRDSVQGGSWMETIFQAVDAGKLDEREAIPLAAVYVSAGIDSTVLGLAQVIVQLSRHPEQWSELRTEPARAEAALHEALRLDAPIQALGRFVTERVDLDGVQLVAGERVWLLLGSAGRDPRKWGLHADRFDLRRPSSDKHLALGAGQHRCPGNYLTLMQARALLRALADHCATLAPAGTPTGAQTHIMRGFTAAPIATSSCIRMRRPVALSPSESTR